ncbi:ABC transporter substrate-binding protein [Thermus oshimai]|jgi:NitT/TauT family transport system substrate-binding protein
MRQSVWWIALLGLVGLGLAQGTKSIRAGLQAGGTFAWVVYAMERYGIAKELGLEVKATTYATKQATEIALRAGEAQVVVDDFVGVVLARQGGIPVQAVYPFSLLTGGVVVRADSPIRGVADLKGKVIGAASLDDKSLLLLRALAVARYGFDPQKEAKVLAVAPPLMAELLRRGELEAALPYWHFIARMVATGEYRELISNAEMLRELGLPTDLPLLLVVAREDTDPEALRLFLRGLNLAQERMRRDEAFWNELLDRGLYALPDRSLLPAVRKRWEGGLATRWDAGVIVGLTNLVQRLVQVAGSEVMGIRRLDPRAFALSVGP